MGSISNELKRCFPSIEEAAHKAACKYRLPWRLEDLKKAGLEGIQRAQKAGRYDEQMGLPFEQQADQWIREAVDSTGKQLQAAAHTEHWPERSNVQIRLALKTFSAEEWQDLIDGFELWDIDALRAYLDANEEPLKKWLGYSKFITIRGREGIRGLILFLSQPLQMTSLTDAMWAAHIRNDARRRNITGESRPSVKRSWGEVGGLNNIAESLSQQGHKVTPYQVKKILERLEQTPFEEFDGDYGDYLLWATDPKAYKRICHLRNTGRKWSRRNPDPYFSQHNCY